jgi:hypothetical protein
VLPQLAETRQRETDRLHLPDQESSALGHRQGAHGHPAGTQPATGLLLDRLTPILGGWTTYFKHGVSKATFDYLRRFTWRRVLMDPPQTPPRELEVDPTALPARVVAHGRRRGTSTPAR